MTQTNEPLKPGWIARSVAWLAVVIVIAVLAASALIASRVWIAAAAVIGIVGAWLLVRFIKLISHRPALRTVAVLTLIAGSLALAVIWLPTYYYLVRPQHIVTVPYHATGQLDGNQVNLQEEILIDESASKELNRLISSPPGSTGAGPIAPPGWTTGPTVDGYPTFTRTRTFTPTNEYLATSNVTIPINLGSIGGDFVVFAVRDGSSVELTSDKGALAAAYPAVTNRSNDPRQEHGEVITIKVDRSIADISLAILKPGLRFPGGPEVYEAATWGPLPWLVGLVFGLVTAFLKDKLKELLGLIARRAMRKPKGTPKEPNPPVASTPAA